MGSSIAIVGMACQFPEASTPGELWENVLAQRQAFRRIPRERLDLRDYHSEDPALVDLTYGTEAALLTGYQFDRLRFQVPGQTYRTTDLAHWLALDIADRTLADAGFPDADGLARHRTGVLVGNTLTGEFSRSSLMRLRWPFVRRVVGDALRREGWSDEQIGPFLAGLEDSYKRPFEPFGEDSLAGGLSNTIAGRIANHFDLRGGGYTVDGACSSSLLAVVQACTALDTGDLDAALVGGVDLSLDPFELVGFARSRALASGPMRVFDRRPTGFIPGEGCGFVLLMREADAVAMGSQVYASIRGWGISSDGQGGLTRPSAEGQLLALRRAYERAGRSSAEVTYFECHGTGTDAGDRAELDALARCREADGEPIGPALIGSVKANTGHTKAAAGIAGLLKTALALHHRILPPTSGCESPCEELLRPDARLRISRSGQRWTANRPRLAGVSAMGFGGINAHVVLEGGGEQACRELDAHERVLIRSPQDVELFLLDATDAVELDALAVRLLNNSGGLSRAELTDLAAELARRLGGRPVRAAIIARHPSELTERLELLRAWIDEGVDTRIDSRQCVFLGRASEPPRILFLFPGHAAPVRVDWGGWERRFPFLGDLRRVAGLDDPGSLDGDPRIAQPAILASSMAGLELLEALGIRAAAGVGHSLGEYTGLFWAGALSRSGVLDLARARGQAVAESRGCRGAMASLAADEETTANLLTGNGVVVAGQNSPRQTLVSGDRDEVAELVRRAREGGVGAVLLPVPYAFHSPLAAPAAAALEPTLVNQRFGPIGRCLVSTVTGRAVGGDDDPAGLLLRQFTAPIRFLDAMRAAVARAGGVDLVIEVGPGSALKSIAGACVDAPVVSLNACGESLRGLLATAGAAHAAGALHRPEALFEGRFVRPFDLDSTPRFLANPCEQAPLVGPRLAAVTSEVQPELAANRSFAAGGPESNGSALALVRLLVSRHTELPLEAVRPDSRFLNDLHLNSIAVARIASEAAHALGRSPPLDPTEFAHATVAGLSRAIEQRTPGSGPAESPAWPAGVDTWTRAFVTEFVPRRRRRPARNAGSRSSWLLVGPADHPLRGPLGRRLQGVGNGSELARSVLLLLPAERDEPAVSHLLEAARALGDAGSPERLVVVQQEGGGAAFARCVHEEFEGLSTTVVDLSFDEPDAVERVLEEAGAVDGFSQVRLGPDGERSVPTMRAIAPSRDGSEVVSGMLPLGADDLLLVSGGGRGLGRHCAVALALRSGCRLALLGRGDPVADHELAASLLNLSKQGISFRYVRADVGNRDAVLRAVSEVEEAFGGRVTAVLHAAGINEPQSVLGLDQEAFRRTLAPKLAGARNLLAAIDPRALRLFVAFGSIIGRTGMHGEADYATANEWLARQCEIWQDQFPAVRFLCLEWSVWSGVGMGVREGLLDGLMRRGIAPIAPEAGVRVLFQLLEQPPPAVCVQISGRLGADAENLELGSAELPLRRFLERPRIRYPGIELVTEAKVSAATDPYLTDHVFAGESLFPGVLGLEAMSQVAAALSGGGPRSCFEHVLFRRPLGVHREAERTLRLAALEREPGRVEVVLRSDENAFQVDHFRALVSFPDREPFEAPADLPLADRRNPVPRDVVDALYGGILFQDGRFRRVREYPLLAAKECIATLGAGTGLSWFGPHHPPELVLGDPGRRDAAIHAIQACIPHQPVLPVSVRRIDVLSPGGLGEARVRARERSREGDEFEFDLVIESMDGSLLECWQGLRLKVVSGAAGPRVWQRGLVPVHLERRLEDLLGLADLRIHVEESQGDRTEGSEDLLRRLLPDGLFAGYRQDGRPLAHGIGLSLAHGRGLSLVVGGTGVGGCDLQSVEQHSRSTWRDLLGPERLALAELLERETPADLNSSATRVWAALECLKKSAAGVPQQLVAEDRTTDDWVVFAAGAQRIATWVGRVADQDDPVVWAVSREGNHADL